MLAPGVLAFLFRGQNAELLFAQLIFSLITRQTNSTSDGKEIIMSANRITDVIFSDPVETALRLQNTNFTGTKKKRKKQSRYECQEVF